MNLDIGIVILHYNDAQMTESYIRNLNNLSWEDLRGHIIVVDNASPDGSGVLLKSKYADSKNVTVLINERNEGFARGNNVGIRYCHESLNAELIVVSNNDIIIEDEKFFLKLWDIYKQEKFAVVGPDIYSLKKEIHQSPIRNRLLTEEDVNDKINKIDKTLKKLMIIQKIHMYDTLSKMKRLLGKKPGIEGVHYSERQKNVVLQGAFFALSTKYMECYPQGLYEKTFLYMEEDILAYLCHKAGLYMLYTPELQVKHIDGYSTLKENGDRCKKYMFELRETKESCKKLIELMEDCNGNF